MTRGDGTGTLGSGTMYLSARWSGNRLRSILRLILGSALSLVVILPDVADTPISRATPFFIAGSIFGLALLAVAIATLAAGKFKARAWKEVIATLVLLITSLINGVVPTWVWSDELAVAGFIVFYLYELRGIVRSNPALYAALAIAGIICVASVSMADAEEVSPDATITSAGVALTWAISQVLRAGAVVDVEPVTPAGDVLGFIIILSGVLFTAVLISSVTAWAVRKGSSSSADSIRQQVRQALVDVGLVSDPHAPEEAESRRRVFVDVDHFVGSRPRNWWRSRILATEDLLNELVTADLADLAPEDGRPVILVAVLEGPSAELATDLRDPSWTFDLVEAGASADDWLLEHATPADLVITNDRHFAERLNDAGIPHQGWSALRK